MHTHQNLQQHLDAADRNWFAAHSTAQWRKRRYIPGEKASVDKHAPEVTHTAVFRRTDGALVRCYFRAVEI